MKLFDVDTADSGVKRLNFATNMKELELLFAVVRNAVQYFPKTLATTVEHRRLCAIRQGLMQGLKSLQHKSDYNPVPAKAKCYYCRRPYEKFGVDFVFTAEQWKLVHPEIDGVVCGSCIAKRVATLEGVVRIKSVLEFE